MVSSSPAYGPKNGALKRMTRELALRLQAALANRKSVIRTPNSHRLRSPTTPKRVRRVKARRISRR